MATTREALETTIALEKESMSLYARLAKLFAHDIKLQDFWFGMARDEARHVGALDLVWTVLDLEGKLDAPSPISLEDSIILRARRSRDFELSVRWKWRSKSRRRNWKTSSPIF